MSGPEDMTYDWGIPDDNGGVDGHKITPEMQRVFAWDHGPLSSTGGTAGKELSAVIMKISEDQKLVLEDDSNISLEDAQSKFKGFVNKGKRIGLVPQGKDEQLKLRSLTEEAAWITEMSDTDKNQGLFQDGGYVKYVKAQSAEKGQGFNDERIKRKKSEVSVTQDAKIVFFGDPLDGNPRGGGAFDLNKEEAVTPKRKIGLYHQKQIRGIGPVVEVEIPVKEKDKGLTPVQITELGLTREEMVIVANVVTLNKSVAPKNTELPHLTLVLGNGEKVEIPYKLPEETKDEE